jgi:hypothetical protein
MCGGIKSDPEIQVVEPVETTVDKNRNSIKYGASTGSAPVVPAWIAQEVCCRSFCVEIILSLVRHLPDRSFLSRKKNIINNGF